jgi:hypothetical protein
MTGSASFDARRRKSSRAFVLALLALGSAEGTDKWLGQDVARALLVEPDQLERQRQLADSWRIAANAAHDGVDAMRDIYPRRHRYLTGYDLPRAGEACHAFEGGLA